MHFHYLLLFAFDSVKCINVEITGDVAFELKLSDVDFHKSDKYRNRAEDDNRKTDDDGLVLKLMKTGPKTKNVTAAPLMECLYQYPEKEQINAVLSDMMNELTKVFVRAHELMGGHQTSRRKQGTRFTVVNKTNTDFFETIYNSMTKEYRQYYDNTTLRVHRSGLDPCEHQEEIKQMWKDLLGESLEALRRASQKCFQKFIEVQHPSTDPKVENKFVQFLVQELEKIRSHQLDILCDKFQLCYNELL